MRSAGTGRVVWRGYRWCGPTATLRLADFPPRYPRRWTRFPLTFDTEWHDPGPALEWLWHHMSHTRHLVRDRSRRVGSLRDEYALARYQLLHGTDAACGWSIELPESIRLCLGIVAVYHLPPKGTIRARHR